MADAQEPGVLLSALGGDAERHCFQQKLNVEARRRGPLQRMVRRRANGAKETDERTNVGRAPTPDTDKAPTQSHLSSHGAR